MRRADLPTDLPEGSRFIVVTLTEGTDAVDGRVRDLAEEEATKAGLPLGDYLGILDEPDAGILCHVFTAKPSANG